MDRHSWVAEVTGRLPVGARRSVRADFLEGRDAAKRGDIETRDRLARGLRILAAQHGLQAIAGIGYAGVNAYYAVRHGSGVVAAEAVYDGLYGSVNGLVTYTQAYLARSVQDTRPAIEAQAAQPVDVAPVYNRNATVAEGLSVVAGQLAFAATIVAPSITNFITS